jgi:hypothetical protein
VDSQWFQHPFIKAFPLSHLMREAFPEHWLRIHSLPNSKRYPDNETERQIVLNRYARFGTALLGERAPCLIIQSRFNGCARTDELMPDLDWAPIHKVEESDEDFYDSWMTTTLWNPESLHALLLAIADDRADHVAFVSKITDCVFIPYDGGADGFSLDTSLLRRLSEEFLPWRSVHPTGL